MTDFDEIISDMISLAKKDLLSDSSKAKFQEWTNFLIEGYFAGRGIELSSALVSSCLQAINSQDESNYLASLMVLITFLLSAPQTEEFDQIGSGLDDKVTPVLTGAFEKAQRNWESGDSNELLKRVMQASLVFLQAAFRRWPARRFSKCYEELSSKKELVQAIDEEVDFDLVDARENYFAVPLESTRSGLIRFVETKRNEIQKILTTYIQNKQLDNIEFNRVVNQYKDLLVEARGSNYLSQRLRKDFTFLQFTFDEIEASRGKQGINIQRKMFVKFDELFKIPDEISLRMLDSISSKLSSRAASLRPPRKFFKQRSGSSTLVRQLSDTQGPDTLNRRESMTPRSSGKDDQIGFNQLFDKNYSQSSKNLFRKESIEPDLSPQKPSVPVLKSFNSLPPISTPKMTSHMKISFGMEKKMNPFDSPPQQLNTELVPPKSFDFNDFEDVKDSKVIDNSVPSNPFKDSVAPDNPKASFTEATNKVVDQFWDIRSDPTPKHLNASNPRLFNPFSPNPSIQQGLTLDRFNEIPEDLTGTVNYQVPVAGGEVPPFSVAMSPIIAASEDNLESPDRRAAHLNRQQVFSSTGHNGAGSNHLFNDNPSPPTTAQYTQEATAVTKGVKMATIKAKKAKVKVSILREEIIEAESFLLAKARDFIEVFNRARQKFEEERRQGDERRIQIEENLEKIEEDRLKIEDDRRQIEDDRLKVEDDRRQLEDDRRQIEKNRRKLDEDKMQIEKDRLKIQDEHRRKKEEGREEEEKFINKKRRFEEEQQLIDAERRQVEEDRRLLDEKQKKIEEERKNIEDEQRGIKEERRQVEENRRRLEEDRRRMDDERRVEKMNEERRKEDERRIDTELRMEEQRRIEEKRRMEEQRWVEEQRRIEEKRWIDEQRRMEEQHLKNSELRELNEELRNNNAELRRDKERLSSELAEARRSLISSHPAADCDGLAAEVRRLSSELVEVRADAQRRITTTLNRIDQENETLTTQVAPRRTDATPPASTATGTALLRKVDLLLDALNPSLPPRPQRFVTAAFALVGEGLGRREFAHGCVSGRYTLSGGGGISLRIDELIDRRPGATTASLRIRFIDSSNLGIRVVSPRVAGVGGRVRVVSEGETLSPQKETIMNISLHFDDAYLLYPEPIVLTYSSVEPRQKEKYRISPDRIKIDGFSHSIVLPLTLLKLLDFVCPPLDSPRLSELRRLANIEFSLKSKQTVDDLKKVIPVSKQIGINEFLSKILSAFGSFYLYSKVDSDNKVELVIYASTEHPLALPLLDTIKHVLLNL